jgi:hypothetical protein
MEYLFLVEIQTALFSAYLFNAFNVCSLVFALIF